MHLEELKKYVKDISILESQRYAYQRIAHIYEKQIRLLEREKNTIYYKEEADISGKNNRKRNFVVPSPDAKLTYFGERKNKSGRTESVFGFRGTYEMFKDIPERWWDDDLRKLEKEEHNKFKCIHIVVFIAAVLLGALASFFMQNVFPLMVSVLAGIGGIHRIGDENSREYLSGHPYYERFMYFYETKYKEELDKKAAIYNPKIKYVNEEYEKSVMTAAAETDILLEKLYKKNIISPEYRNFVAVTQIYDYLEMGRCTKLEGTDGAYALYENELKESLITTDFNISNYQLDKYSASMSTMVSLIKYINTITDNISLQLKGLESNTAIMAYYIQCVSIQDEMMEHYKIGEVKNK